MRSRLITRVLGAPIPPTSLLVASWPSRGLGISTQTRGMMNTFTPDGNGEAANSTTTTAATDLSRSRRWHARMLVRQLRMLATGAHGGDRALRRHLIDSIKHSVKYCIVEEERWVGGDE